MALVINQRLAENIFLIKGFNYDRQVFTPATRRKEVQQAKAITERRKQETNNQGKSMSIKDLINSRLREKKDSTQTNEKPPEVPKAKKVNKDSINTNDYTFDDEPVKTEPIQSKRDTIVIPERKETPINTEDYVFEEEASKTKQPSETFLTRYLKARENTRIMGPFAYDPKFSYENLITNFCGRSATRCECAPGNADE